MEEYHSTNIAQGANKQEQREKTVRSMTIIQIRPETSKLKRKKEMEV